jgi:RNA recognition motif-containing protein
METLKDGMYSERFEHESALSLSFSHTFGCTRTQNKSGFVEFWNTDACDKAATLNGKNLLGRKIRIDWSD